jgi:hypothetical protein
MINISDKNKTRKVVILFVIVYLINTQLLKKQITAQGVQTFMSNTLFFVAMQNTPLFLL